MTKFWQVTKYALTALLLILVPTYLYHYGPENFLWLSDIALFLTFFALWLNSTLLMSMAAVGTMALELVWCFDFFMDLFFNINPIDLSDYMFDTSLPAWLRALSLFHVVTPTIWIIYLLKVGYNKKAMYFFTPLFWLVLTITYLLPNPSENINWVHQPLISVPQIVWFFILAIGFPIFIFLPTHLIYKKLFKSSCLDNKF